MKLSLEKIELSLAAFSLQVDVTLDGRVMGLFGPSGAGKTTLAEIVAGLRHHQRGRVSVDTRILADTDRGIFTSPEHRGIGYVPQDGALFPHLNVQRNLMYGFRAHGTEEDHPTFEKVCAVLAIGDLLERNVTHLSGGEKQRVALARALLAAPRLLVLDEPLSGLDIPLRARLVPYLESIRDEFEIPMIYISHSADEIVQLCDQVIVLNRGQVVSSGAPREIFVQQSLPRYVIREEPPA